MLSRDRCMVPYTSSKKVLGVVTPLVTAEREQASFFCQDGSFFVHASPLFLLGASGSFCIFVFIFNSVFVLFSFDLFLLISSDNAFQIKFRKSSVCEAVFIIDAFCLI